MGNNRKLKRRHLIYYLRVFDKNSGKLMGHLVDVTQEGILLISEEPVPENTEYSLNMVLPETLEGEEMIEFRATSLWSKRDINPSFIATGYKIHDLSTEKSGIISSLVERFGFND